MVTPNKKYVSINRQSLLLILVVGSKQINIEFRPGYGVSNNGYYLTNDPEIQEALEGDKRFGKSYQIDTVNNIPYPEWTARQELAAKQTAAEVAAKEANSTPGGKVTVPADPVTTETQDTDSAPGSDKTSSSTDERSSETTGEQDGNKETTELILKTFSLVQDAKDFLNKEYLVPFHEITNKNKVIAKGKELGFDIKIQ